MTENISKLRIEGGTPLVGEVHVRGAKNLVPKAMVAALHGSTPSTLRNVPDLSDVENRYHPRGAARCKGRL